MLIMKGAFDHVTGKENRRTKNATSKNSCKEHSMALRIRLEWYDKSTDLGLGEELSNIIEDNDFVFTTLGLTDEHQIFDGGYNVLPEWISLLQSYFTHPIDTARHDYQIAFRLP
ncbi:hypothetical protein ABIA58_001300 [Pseudomonas frederiksbergensis]